MSFGFGGFRTSKVSTMLRGHGEHELQSECKAWFDAEHPGLAPLFFAVPNGGSRLTREAVRLKAEGVVAGVSDMILMVPNRSHNVLCIEFKYGSNKQSAKQKEWEAAAVSHGAKYAVIYKKEDFITLINEYLSNVGTDSDYNRCAGRGGARDDNEHDATQEDA